MNHMFDTPAQTADKNSFTCLCSAQGCILFFSGILITGNTAGNLKIKQCNELQALSGVFGFCHSNIFLLDNVHQHPKWKQVFLAIFGATSTS